MSVVGADVAGHDEGRTSYGATAIYDHDGEVLASAEPLTDGLVFAEIPTRDRRGHQGGTSNAATTLLSANTWRHSH